MTERQRLIMAYYQGAYEQCRRFLTSPRMNRPQREIIEDEARRLMDELVKLGVPLEPNCWELTLADGQKFVWGHDNDVYSAAEARAALLAQEPDAVIILVEAQRVVWSIDMEEN